MAKKPTRQQEGRPADPAIYAALEVVMDEAKARFEPQARPLVAEIRALSSKSKEHGLTSVEEAQMIVLRSRFDALAIEYKQFIVPVLEVRLSAHDGDETADA